MNIGIDPLVIEPLAVQNGQCSFDDVFIEHGDVPQQTVELPEGISPQLHIV